MFSGSVNLGIAALTDGFAGPPSLVAAGQITPDDQFTFASADVAAVPLPAGLPLAATGVVIFGLASLRRRGGRGSVARR